MVPVMLVLSGEAGPDNSRSITKFNISAVIAVQARSGDGNAAQFARTSPVLIFRVTTREHATVSASRTFVQPRRRFFELLGFV